MLGRSEYCCFSLKHINTVFVLWYRFLKLFQTRIEFYHRCGYEIYLPLEFYSYHEIFLVLFSGLECSSLVVLQYLILSSKTFETGRYIIIVLIFDCVLWMFQLRNGIRNILFQITIRSRLSDNVFPGPIRLSIYAKRRRFMVSRDKLSALQLLFTSLFAASRCFGSINRWIRISFLSPFTVSRNVIGTSPLWFVFVLHR